MENREDQSAAVRAKRTAEAIVERLIWIVVAPLTFTCRIFNYLRGVDLDGEDGDGGKAGYSGLTFLGTFAVVQGAALGIGSRGQGGVVQEQWNGQQATLVFIYIALSIFTVWGIVRILRLPVPIDSASHGSEAPNKDRQTPPKKRHAYDSGTIAFGRWILYASTFTSVSFAVLAFVGGLPGQSVERRIYTSDDVPCTTSLFYQQIQTQASNVSPNEPRIVQDTKRMNKWILWMWLGVAPKQDDKVQFLWVEQIEPFDVPYQDFVARVKLTHNFTFVEGAAFLVSSNSPREYRPIYRQLRNIPVSNKDLKDTNRFEVVRPNAGERLLIFMRVKNETEKSLTETSADEFGVEIINDQS